MLLTTQSIFSFNGCNVQEWALLNTDSKSTFGKGFYVQLNEDDLKFYRKVEEFGTAWLTGPRVIVALYVCETPREAVSVEEASETKHTHLMSKDPKHLPQGETKWTFRSWVLKVLDILAKGLDGKPGLKLPKSCSKSAAKYLLHVVLLNTFTEAANARDSRED